VIPKRIRWAVETLAVQPADRLLEIGGGPGLAASLICERLEAAGCF
jgi:protein-L-isoaspartate O-methyltransferase